MNDKITYYTTPDTIYDNEVDVVKGTSLTGKEVDKNFNTLEGRDIKNVTVSEDGKSIEIHLINGKIVECDNLFDNAITSIDYTYDRVCGELKIIVNNDIENQIVITGFITKDDVFEMVANKHVYTDATIEGNGMITSPLRIARMQKTGLFRPVIDIVEELPENAAAGDRYIVNEEVNLNGSLYNYQGVKNIIANLKNTGWHVPTKADWDDMLNALEPERADRNHCRKDCNVYLGEVANQYLTNSDYNFNGTLCGYANEEPDKHVVYNGEREIWWTASNEGGRNAYIKRIDANSFGVYQDIVDGANFYSVRLVRDITPSDTFGAENIMDQIYNVAVMPSVKKGLRLWTASNFGSELKDIQSETTQTTTEKKCNGTVVTTTTTAMEITEEANDTVNRFTPEDWESIDKTYICEFDGTKWIKNEVKNYDMFFSTTLETLCYFKDGELITVGTEGDSNTCQCTNESRIAALETAVATLQAAIENLTNPSKTPQEIIDGAMNYRYADREMVGSFTRSGNNITYIPGSTNSADILNDFARLIGALYWAENVNTVTYSDVDYTWTPSLGLKGSNYSSDGTLETTLMKTVTEEFQQNNAQPMSLTFNGATFTVSFNM